MGDTIMVRAFASVPRLEEITFLRPNTRDFVTGGKPYPLSLPVWFPYIFLLSAATFAAFGLYLTLAAHFPTPVLGRPLASNDDWMGQIGPFVLVGVILEFGIWAYFRKLVRGDQKLAHVLADRQAVDDRVLEPEITGARELHHRLSVEWLFLRG